MRVIGPLHIHVQLHSVGGVARLVAEVHLEGLNAPSHRLREGSAVHAALFEADRAIDHRERCGRAWQRLAVQSDVNEELAGRRRRVANAQNALLEVLFDDHVAYAAPTAHRWPNHAREPVRRAWLHGRRRGLDGERSRYAHGSLGQPIACEAAL